MHRLLWLALAGAIGTLCRYGLTVWLRGALVGKGAYALPLATGSVNVLGCLLLGLALGLLHARGQLDSPTTLAITVGFLGAFTTFSAFAFESGDLLFAPGGEGRLAGVLNLVLSPALGVLAYLGGSGLAWLFPPAAG